MALHGFGVCIFIVFICICLMSFMSLRYQQFFKATFFDCTSIQRSPLEYFVLFELGVLWLKYLRAIQVDWGLPEGISY